MAFYRKKRRKAGPSKNEEKVQRARDASDHERAGGTIATRFPSVRSLAVTLSIATAQGVVLEETSHTYGPNDPFFLEADCPGSCGSGVYDFADSISKSLDRLEERGSLQIVCAESSYGGGPGGTCGCVAKLEYSAVVAVS